MTFTVATNVLILAIPVYLWYAPGEDAEELPQVLTPDMLVERAEASQ